MSASIKAPHLLPAKSSLKPGEEWRYEQGWLVARLVDGAVYWLGGGGPFELSVGDTIVVPHNCPGTMRASIVSGATIIFFSWRPDLTRGLLTPNESRWLLAYHGKVRVFQPGSGIDAELTTVLGSTQDDPTFVVRARALGLIATLISGDLREARQSETGSRLERFKSVIDQCGEDGLLTQSVAQLAGTIGYSPRQFTRLFQQNFGMSFREKQKRLRLERAQKTLEVTDDRISQIALQSGFRQVGLFNRLFKKAYGVTPSAWRRQRHMSNGE